MNMNILSRSLKIHLFNNLINRSLHLTSMNYAQPLKAKKKTDPLMDKLKEDRKRRRYEKVITKLGKI